MDPSNELIKEGPIQKISTRNNSTSEKYLFLVGAGMPRGRDRGRTGTGRGTAQPGRGVAGSSLPRGDEFRAGGFEPLSAGHPVEDMVGNQLIPWARQPLGGVTLQECFAFPGWERAVAKAVTF